MCLLIYFNVCIKRLVVLLFVHPARNYRWSIYYYRARREILGHKKNICPNTNKSSRCMGHKTK